MAHGQGGAEIARERSPTLTCNHEAPIIVVHGSQDPIVSVDLAHTLGRNSGQENALLCFDTTQITSVSNRSNPQIGDPCHTFAATSNPPAVIAFSCKDCAVDAGPLAPTLRSMGHDGSHANAGGQAAVCVTGDITHTLTAEGFDASEDGTGRGQPIIPVGQYVRRLTPKECERLQGFPDGHTDVAHKGKPAADGQRYKATGNSKAVPVVRWIGARIERALAGGFA
jgi:DNA (cytosine-5)-methyltransferase 1